MLETDTQPIFHCADSGAIGECPATLAPVRLLMPLVRHEALAASWSGTVFAGAARAGSDVLHLGFLVSGDIGRLRLPAYRGVERGERLWEHTCFEAFVEVAGQASYVEFNFAPSGAWAAYDFSSYRAGMAERPGVAPEVAVSRTRGRLELAVRVRFDAALARGATVRVGLSAVIEDSAGNRSYWALHHANGKPDFHRPESRVLLLAIPDDEAAGSGRAEQS